MPTNSTGFDFIQVGYRIGKEKRPAKRDHLMPPDTYEKGGAGGVREEKLNRKNTPNLQ